MSVCFWLRQLQDGTLPRWQKALQVEARKIRRTSWDRSGYVQICPLFSTVRGDLMHNPPDMSWYNMIAACILSPLPMFPSHHFASVVPTGWIWRALMLDDLTHPHVSFNTRHIYDSFSHIFVVIHSHSHSVLFILVHSCSFLFTNLFYLYYLLSHIILLICSFVYTYVYS